MPSILNATTSSGLVTSADNSGSLQLATNNGTTAVTIDTSQNVGIGTTTMTRQLNIGNSSNAVGIGFQNTGTSGKNWSIFSTNAGSSVGGGNLGFYNDTDTAYRMIIDGSGRVGIGTTTPSNRLVVQDSDTTGTAVNIINTSSGGYNWNIFSCGSAANIDSVGSLAFRDSTNGSTRMAITSAGRMYFYSLAASAGTNALRWSTSTGQMTYDTSSARYKDNIRDSVYGLNHVMQMRSTQFEYKDDGRSDIGLIAEELQPIVPELVGLDKDGQADSVSYDRMVSVLVKAIQELNAKVDAQALEIQALKGVA